MARSVVYEDDSITGTRLNLEPMEDRLLVSINIDANVLIVTLTRSDVQRLYQDIWDFLHKDMKEDPNG